jgi:hypothetical protein
MDWLPIAIAFVLAAALLGVAAEVAAAAVGRPARAARVLGGLAIWLAAAGVWWPPHVLPAEGTAAAARGAQAMLAWLPALALAGLGALTAWLLQRRRWAVAIAAGVATLVAAYAHAMLSTPGLFGVARWGEPVGAGAVLLALAVSIAALHLRLVNPRWARAARQAAAVTAAAVLTLACAGAPGLAGAMHMPAWTELVGIVALAAMAGALLASLPRRRNATRSVAAWRCSSSTSTASSPSTTPTATAAAIVCSNKWARA